MWSGTGPPPAHSSPAPNPQSEAWHSSGPQQTRFATEGWPHPPCTPRRTGERTPSARPWGPLTAREAPSSRSTTVRAGRAAGPLSLTTAAAAVAALPGQRAALGPRTAGRPNCQQRWGAPSIPLQSPRPGPAGALRRPRRAAAAQRSTAGTPSRRTRRPRGALPARPPSAGGPRPRWPCPRPRSTPCSSKAPDPGPKSRHHRSSSSSSITARSTASQTFRLPGRMQLPRRSPANPSLRPPHTPGEVPPGGGLRIEGSFQVQLGSS
jgi:hypothetical protein